MLQEYLDQLFDAFKEGICISDVEGTVVHLNRRHAEITGIPREEMLGHSVMEFVKRGRLDVVLNPEVMRTGQPATRVQTVSDGRKLILEANPVFRRAGQAGAVHHLPPRRDHALRDAGADERPEGTA